MPCLSHNQLRELPDVVIPRAAAAAASGGAIKQRLIYMATSTVFLLYEEKAWSIA